MQSIQIKGIRENGFLIEKKSTNIDRFRSSRKDCGKQETESTNEKCCCRLQQEKNREKVFERIFIAN